MAEITVRDNPAQSRYDVLVDEAPAGFAAYRHLGRQVIFTHTSVDPAFGGQGVGGALARGALDDVRERGLQVTPLCPFIAGWIAKHPDYADLVDAANRGSLPG